MLDPVLHDDAGVGQREVKNTTCYMCACRCGIRVTLRDGEVRHIEGNPNHPLNQGVICAKGASGIMKQYSPARLTKPLRRKELLAMAESARADRRGSDQPWLPLVFSKEGEGRLYYTATLRYALEALTERTTTSLRLQDIATVLYGAPALSYGRRLNGEPAVAFWIQKASGFNTVEVCRAVEIGDRARAAAMRDSINRDWDCGRAYLPEDLPAAWNAGNSPRYPELVVQPDPGCGVITRASDSHRLLPGDHGWPPDHPDMWGIFYAAGPRIPAGTVTGPVRVVDVHPLMLAILGLEAPGATDGDPRVLASRLLPESE